MSIVKLIADDEGKFRISAMARPKIQNETKKAEGSYVKAAFERKKSEERDLTEDKLAAEMGFSQGLIGQWFAGRTNIRDEHLIWLGSRLGFDPHEIRPSLSKYDKAKLSRDILHQYSALPAEDRDLIDAMIRRAYERYIER